MIYNNIQSFITDIDERLAELRALNDFTATSLVTAGSKVTKLSRGDTLREKKKYMHDYQAQLKEYSDQVEAFTRDYESYTENIAKGVRKALSPEIEKFKDTHIEVLNNTDSYYGALGYYIKLFYKSPKRDKEKYVPAKLNGRSGTAYGISWNLSIFLKERRDAEGNVVECAVSKSPYIQADFLESDDYDALNAMRKLFIKVDNLDWTKIINDANSNTPVRESYGTAEHPGVYSTAKWDADADYYYIERTAGTDIWVKVTIKRESSYNAWSDNARNAGVHDTGWIKLNSYTDTYYSFNWLANWQRRGPDYHDGYPEEVINKALGHEVRLKKIYVKLFKPINYMTTEELTLEPGEIR